MATEDGKGILYAVSYSAAMNLHIKVLPVETAIMWQRPCLKALRKPLMQQHSTIPGSQTCFLPREASDTEGDHL